MLVSRVENNSEGEICSVNILGDIKSGVALDKSNGSHILFDTPDILLINANRKNVLFHQVENLTSVGVHFQSSCACLLR